MPNADEQRTPQDRAQARWESLQHNWRRRARINKAISMLLVYLSVTLAVTATVLAVMPGVAQWLVAAASGGTVLTTTLMATTKVQEHWVLARSIQIQLHTERFLYKQQAGRYAPATTSTDEARVRLFSERITEIQRAGHESWATRMVTTPPAVAPPAPTLSAN